jgi:hypothetical protein
MYVCPSAWGNSAPTERIFISFEYGEYIKNMGVPRKSAEKIQV